MRRCSTDGVTAPGAVVAHPGVVRERIADLFGGLWRGGVGDLSFPLAVVQVYTERGLAAWYRDVVFLARYLRQSIPWIEALTWGEFWDYYRATVALVKLENGSGDAVSGGLTGDRG